MNEELDLESKLTGNSYPFSEFKIDTMSTNEAKYFVGGATTEFHAHIPKDLTHLNDSNGFHSI